MSPEAVSRFKEVAEAYAVLTNERERKRYARERRREHAAREQHRRQQAQAAQRRTAEPRSETAAAAERAFWEYARQVKARRQQASQTRPAPVRKSAVDWWGDRIGPAIGVLLMASYLWRSAHGLPLQPWLPAGMFATHPLSSPIWITLGLGLLMIVRPHWCRIPLVMDEIKDVRLGGWGMLLVPPLLHAGLGMAMLDSFPR